MWKKRRAEQHTCCRCENVDDLGVIRGQLYCRPCRTCPHGQVYVYVWEPPCWQCVRDIHTLMTFTGPRILDVEEYVADATTRWGLGPADVVPHTFAEQSRVFGAWIRALPDEPSVTVDVPPHFIKRT